MRFLKHWIGVPIFQQWLPGHETSSYRGIISQNVFVACNSDLEFIYVLSRWERSTHNSKLLSNPLSRNNGLKGPRYYFEHLIVMLYF